MKTVIILLLCCFSVYGFTQNTQAFEEGNTLYNSGKYKEAIDKYESTLDSGMQSSELYYNLGNANYKLNNIAPSIYYFEKALILNPNDKDIKNNLAFAKNMTIDAIDKLPEVGFTRITKNVVNTFTTDIWAKIAIGGIILFVLLFLLYHFSYSSFKKRTAFVVSIVSLIIGFISVLMAFQKDRLNTKNNPAIVFAQESRVKVDPNNTSEALFTLHEGTKVQVLETYDDWKKIQLSDMSTGWIPTRDIKLLKDF